MFDYFSEKKVPGHNLFDKQLDLWMSGVFLATRGPKSKSTAMSLE